MKVLFVVPRYHTNMLGWVKAFNNAGDEVVVNTMRQGATENYDIIMPKVFPESSVATTLIKIFGSGGPNAPRSFPNPFKYFKYLTKLKPDVVVVRDITRWFSFLAAICARILGIKVVIYSQMPLYNSYSLKRKNAINILNRIFRSYWMTPILGNYNNAANLPDKVVFIPFVSDIVHTASFHRNSEVVSILTIGKFVERKNHLELIKVLRDLKTEGYIFRLIIAGENSTAAHSKKLSEIQNYIVTNDLEKEVTILENVPNKEMDHLYAETELFILPASKEPASISVVEAMGYGIPVISADTNGTSCYIENNVNGYIFKEGSFEDLKNCITNYLNEPNKRILRANCLIEAQKSISSKTFINLFKKHLNN